MGMGFGMVRGDIRESQVKRLVQEREADARGYRTKPRIYEMESGLFLEVVWDGADRNVYFNSFTPHTILLKGEEREGVAK